MKVTSVVATLIVALVALTAQVPTAESQTLAAAQPPAAQPPPATQTRSAALDFCSLSMRMRSSFAALSVSVIAIDFNTSLRSSALFWHMPAVRL